MNDFRFCLEDCGLMDLGFIGHRFTWTNKRGGANNIQERLDRAVANESWLVKFPEVEVSHLTRLLSDHCPVFIKWNELRSRYGNVNRVRLFRFETMWLQEDNCSDIVKERWEGLNCRDAETLANNISRCGMALTGWNDKHFGALPKEIKKCKTELTRLQTRVQTQEVVDESRSLENRIGALLRKEEIYWLQRTASGRKKRNHIDKIADEFGREFVEEEEIQKVFVDYFSGLFSANDNLDMEEAMGAVEHRFSSDTLNSLVLPFTEKDVKNALFQMHPGKAPGPDEALSALIRKNIESGALHGLKICRQAPVVSRLFFADDTIIFGRATETELGTVKEILARYEAASGQAINLNKSEIMFSGGVPLERRRILADFIGVRCVDQHAIYLGIPTSVGRSRDAIFRTLAGRIEKKLKDWKNKTLSQAGKLVLIKSVAQAIPTYLMSCFKIPYGTIDRIRSAIMRFWWGQKGEERRTHWVRWRELCKPKWEGGLGLRDLRVFNMALLAKQGWRLVNDKESLLARTLRARYFPRGDFLLAHTGHNASYTWQSIIEGRKVLERGLLWVVGDGHNIKIWKDHWLFGGASSRVISERGDMNEEAVVRELMRDDHGGWDVQLVQQIFSAPEARTIINMPFCSSRPDRLMWNFEKNGIYSAKTGYIEWMKHIERAYGTPGENKWKWVWKLNVSPKVQLFMWRVLKGILPTNVNLISKYVNIEPGCVGCDGDFETTKHALIECPCVSECWRSLHFAVPSLNDQEMIDEWLFRGLTGWSVDETERVVTLMWAIWYMRNERVFQRSTPSSEKIIGIALRHLDDYRAAVNKRPVQLRIQRDDRWCPPEEGIFKLNADASCQLGIGTGVGGLLRDEYGAVELIFAQKLTECLSIEIAEANAILIGVRCAVEKGVRRMVIETDSQIVYYALMRDGEDLSHFGGLIFDIKSACAAFVFVAFNWVRRSGNHVAHCLSRFAFGCDSLLCSSSIPELIVNSVNADISGI